MNRQKLLMNGGEYWRMKITLYARLFHLLLVRLASLRSVEKEVQRRGSDERGVESGNSIIYTFPLIFLLFVFY